MKKTERSPQFLYDEHGNKVGVLVSKNSYEKIMDIVDDYHDYKAVMKFSDTKTKKTFSRKKASNKSQEG